MKCQNCGNELDQEEVFCGQCGAPNATPAQPTEMMQAPAPSSSLLGDAYRSRSGAFPPNQSSLFAPESVPGSQQSAIRQTPQQGGGFYQDATEAISSVPGASVNYPPSAYPQQGLSGGSLPGRYNNSGQFGTQAQQQPFSTGNYSNTNYPPTQMSFPGSQFGQGGYGTNSGMGMTPQEHKRSNVVMIVGIVCLVFAIITVGIFGVLFTLRNGNNQPQPTPVVQVTATPTATPSPTPTPTPSPTPTVAVTPTPAPDANFSWCSICMPKGYQIEYPDNWSQSELPDQSVKFTDQSQTIQAVVKTPTGSSSPADLINADIAQLASQTSSTAAPASACTTNPPISGESWNCEMTILVPNADPTHPIQTWVYATIYQGKAYLIELVAPQSSFADDQSQFFNPMLARFQFVTPTQ